MPKYDLDSATSSDMTGEIPEVTVDAATLDSPSVRGETEYINTKWAEYYGFFLNIPSLHSAVIMKSVWTVGKGYTTEDSRTKVLLRSIRGWGKESFRDILMNLDMVKNIGGDSYAEIIRDPKTDLLLNLKPLNPANIKLVTNKQGLLIRYEELSTRRKYKPEQIFHLSNCRIGDQIHGISRIEPLKETISAKNEAMKATRKVMRFQGQPYILWKLKTDDTNKIAKFKTTITNARKYGEDNFIPDDDDLVTHDVIQINPSTFILEWMRYNDNEFYRGMGMPLVLFGQAGQTESGSKIEFTGHGQVWEHDQRYIEDQVRSQLGLIINLIHPESLLDNLKTDEKKDANQGQEFQKGDVTAGVAR